jgi:hypothetical protein
MKKLLSILMISISMNISTTEKDGQGFGKPSYNDWSKDPGGLKATASKF